VFWEFRNPNNRLSNPRLAGMRCGYSRPGWDFARAFAREFGSVLTSILDFVFRVLPIPDLRVYQCFLSSGCWPGPVFGRFWISF
jgi:hypothetical protein